jgi:uncharacterized protein YdeI (YjbR/CyaY-like superfamily)
MDEAPLLDLRDRAAWRAWLAAHHGQPGRVCLVIPRKGHGALTAVDASEEALCFGWLSGWGAGPADTQDTKRIDRAPEELRSRKRIGMSRKFNEYFDDSWLSFTDAGLPW